MNRSFPVISSHRKDYSAKVVFQNNLYCVIDTDMEKDNIAPIPFRSCAEATAVAKAYEKNGSRFLSGSLLACTPASPWFGLDVLPYDSVASVLTKAWPEVSKHVFRNEAFNSGEMLYAGGKYSVSLQSTVESGNIMIIVRGYHDSLKCDVLYCHCFPREVSLPGVCMSVGLAENHGFDSGARILSMLREN